MRGPGGQLKAFVAVDGHVFVGEADLPHVAARVLEDRAVMVQRDLGRVPWLSGCLGVEG